MTKGRLEAFSDGVIAIIITVMVLELKVPHGAGWDALQPMVPPFLSYVVSFTFIGIYWNNHHHMLQAVHHINGASLWANLHLLFWLSLTPVVTAWIGDTQFAPAPVALYGVVLLMSGVAYYMLARILVAQQGPDSALAKALGKDRKGLMSIFIYVAAVALSFENSQLAMILYVAVAVMWLVPDRRIERTIKHEHHEHN